MKRGSQSKTVVLLVALGTFAFGCKSEVQKKCEQLIKSSEVSLLSMNPTDQSSVVATAEQLKKTVAACQTANSAALPEVKEGLKNVEYHLNRLKKGEIKPPPPPPGAQELADLQSKGDPGCPKGQAYQHPVTKKTINCTGFTMVQRNYAEVLAYFEKHHIQTARKASMIRGLQAGVTYTFHFDQVDSQKAALCLTIEAPKDKKPNELLAFATSLPPSTIEAGKPIELEGREVAVQVTVTGETQEVVIGKCEGAQPLTTRAAAAPVVSPEPAPAGPAQVK